METKRQVMELITTHYLTNSEFKDIKQIRADFDKIMERYDAAQDDKPTASPDRPGVHEIAMRLMAGDWACPDGPEASPGQTYIQAQALYEAGTAWEQRDTDNQQETTNETD